jgi:hypothetical protein
VKKNEVLPDRLSSAAWLRSRRRAACRSVIVPADLSASTRRRRRSTQWCEVLVARSAQFRSESEDSVSTPSFRGGKQGELHLCFHLCIGKCAPTRFFGGIRRDDHVYSRHASQVAGEGGSNNSCFDSLSGHQFSDLPARVKHTCFDRVLRDTRDVGDLIDRFLMVIDQVDDLTMRRRQLC